MENNLNKIENLFAKDLKVKKLLHEIIPTEYDCYDNDSRLEYVNRVLDCLEEIDLYLSSLIMDFNLANNLLPKFKAKIKVITNDINSGKFFRLLTDGFYTILKYIDSHVSDMREEFIFSVHKGFVGHYAFFGSDVLDPITIQEYLHYIHSYVINNNWYYNATPIVKTTKQETYKEGISLRGKNTEIGSLLYEAIIKSNIAAGDIDIINLDTKMLIMAKGLGHAAVIEIDLTDENQILINYSIPKNTNQEMMSKLRGIKVNNPDFAIGDFWTTKDKFINDICAFMSKIPTDRDQDKTFSINK